MIDYLQLMKATGLGKNSNREQEISLAKAIESLTQTFSCTRLELPGKHAAHLFWVVYRVAHM